MARKIRCSPTTTPRPWPARFLPPSWSPGRVLATRCRHSSCRSWAIRWWSMCASGSAPGSSARTRGPGEVERDHRGTLNFVRERITSRNVTSRVVRPGEAVPLDDEWLGYTVEQRINVVWELTKQCYAWNQDDSVELGLQRSVSHVQRTQR